MTDRELLATRAYEEYKPPEAGLSGVISRHVADAMKAELLAVIAELERMLRLAAVDYIHGGKRSPEGVPTCGSCQAWLADLRARAEEGSES